MDPLYTDQFAYLGWIVLFPLLGAIINGIVGPKLPRRLVNWIGCGSIFLSFMVSLASFQTLWFNGHSGEHGESQYGEFTYTAYEWIYSGALHLDISFLLDPLSAVMILVITGVGFLIHVYSVGYMEEDPGVARYFAYLNLFCFAMLMLVLGKNMLVTFIGWEGVGLCSYLLIGFWYEDDANAQAGQKAFIVNRVGDFAFLAGLFLLYYAAGTFDYVELEQIATSSATAGTLLPIALPAALLIFVGCTGKSAQIPLYTWLPDAMAGPTPVSALIHAATMVTAGVFLIARMHFLFSFQPAIGLTVATVGTLTAFFAATIAVVQNDIKKVLAYSTISQLGYMFMAVGVGAYTAGIFHLMTHAFFKALLFLGSGSVIHAMAGEQDIRKMGGLRKWMPSTAITFLIASFAISGLPLLTAGWFSKDMILWNALSQAHIFSVPAVVASEPSIHALTDQAVNVVQAGGGASLNTWASAFHWGFFIFGVLTAGLTAFYMFRLYILTFEGDCRADEETKDHLHESPESMTVPLWALAILSLVGGYIGWPHFVPAWLAEWMGAGAHGHMPSSLNWMLGIEHWLDEVFHVSTHYRMVGRFGAHAYNLELIATLVSSVVAVGGILLAAWVYLKNPGLPKEIADSLQGLYKLLFNKYWVDEIYDRVFVQGVIKIGSFFYAFDKYVIDGLVVDGIGWLAEQAGRILGYLQGGNVQRYATYIVVAIVLFIVSVLFL